MFETVKISFKDNDPKEKRLFEEMYKSLKELEKKINRGDFNVSSVNRYDEEFLMGDYYLPRDVYGEIVVEGDDIYKDSIIKTMNGTKSFVNWLIW